MARRPRSTIAVLACLFLVNTATAEAAPSRIVIAGDSTASRHEQERHPRMGWGQVLPGFLAPDIDVLNLAISGRSTRSYVDQGHLAALQAALRPGDMLLIQFGHNDAKQDDPSRFADPVTDFPAGLRRFIEVARRAGATPVLLTPVTRRSFDAEGRVIDTHGAYAQSVRALAQDEAVGLVDLSRLSMDWLAALGPEASKAWFLHDSAIGLADDTHFNERGATAVACLVAGELVRLALLPVTGMPRDADCGVPPDHAQRHLAQRHPSLIEHAEAIARVQPGPHGGSGLTIASPFFADAPGFGLAVRRRVLHAGASIGLHAHGKDEVYYIVSGRGELTLDGVARIVTPGSAVLTRDGSSHSLRQLGSEDLTVLIVYALPGARPDAASTK